MQKYYSAKIRNETFFTDDVKLFVKALSDRIKQMDINKLS